MPNTEDEIEKAQSEDDSRKDEGNGRATSAENKQDSTVGLKDDSDDEDDDDAESDDGKLLQIRDFKGADFITNRDGSYTYNPERVKDALLDFGASLNVLVEDDPCSVTVDIDEASAMHDIKAFKKHWKLFVTPEANELSEKTPRAAINYALDFSKKSGSDMVLAIWHSHVYYLSRISNRAFIALTRTHESPIFNIHIDKLVQELIGTLKCVSLFFRRFIVLKYFVLFSLSHPEESQATS